MLSVRSRFSERYPRRAEWTYLTQKFEYRSSKSETNSNSRMIKPEKSFRILSFLTFGVCFGLRASTFGFPSPNGEGATGGGVRTHTLLRVLDFESSASASSATPAGLATVSHRIFIN